MHHFLESQLIVKQNDVLINQNALRNRCMTHVRSLLHGHCSAEIPVFELLGKHAPESNGDRSVDSANRHAERSRGRFHVDA